MNPEVEKINKQISKLTSKLNKIRESCEHENVDLEYKADTGNYDPSSDCWWISGNCLDCGKFLTADSEKDLELYRKYSRKIKR